MPPRRRSPQKRAELLAELEAVQAELLRRRGGKRVYCPHRPHPKQAEFLQLGCLEALYGGAAGGGKSDALLMAALQYAHVPDYAALVLRRTYADLALPGAIMDRAKEWLIPQGVAWNEQKKRFTFPAGATLTFGYLDTDRDRFRYQGAEFQFVAFDELTQFPEASYRYLLSRLRRLEGSQVPVRVRAASNPGGAGHHWVKRRFIDAPEDRVFVPAKLADNPSVDAVEYRRALALLDTATRSQLLDGIWIQDAGGLVYRGFSAGRNLVREAPRCDYYMLGLDLGFVDATAFVILGWCEHDSRVYVVEAYKREGMTPVDVAEEVTKLSERYEFVRMVADIGGLGKGYVEEARKRFSLPLEPAEKVNKTGYISLMNGALERGDLVLVEGLTEPLREEWESLPWSDETKTKEADIAPNHCADACLYVWRAANAWGERPKEKPPEPGTPEYYAAEEARMLEQAQRRLEDSRTSPWWAQ